MERLDKVISNYTNYTRSDAKRLVKEKRIKVNNEVIFKSDVKIDLAKDKICIDDVFIEIKEKIYLALNKPKGYITATEDKIAKTVLDLISEEYRIRNIFPVGRLDKDTTGLIILTNDGEFAHNITSPNKNKSKVYIATLDIPITPDMKIGFENGIELSDGKCKPAKLEKISENIAKVTITEGRYHQIKRMFGCFGAKVIELKRVQIGNFVLPEDLREGEFKELTYDEVQEIILLQ